MNFVSNSHTLLFFLDQHGNLRYFFPHYNRTPIQVPGLQRAALHADSGSRASGTKQFA